MLFPFIPSWIKRLIRVPSFVFIEHVPSPELPEKVLENCQMVYNRYSLLEKLPKNGIAAEVGVFRGHFSKEICKKNQPKDLHLIDATFHYFEDFDTNTNIIRKEGMSWELLGQYDDNYFDWIYIDADHSYNGVKRDIEIASKKVRSGGYLVFDDFSYGALRNGHKFGVHNAVSEFICKNEWEMSYFAFNHTASYNVAIRKP